MKNKELGIYIHIPFCKSKCYYCDFISYANKCNKIEEYIDQLIKQIDEYNFKKYNVTTIYIGGGTPSFIDEKFIQKILEKIRKSIDGNETKFENIEITIEINPGTINKNKLEIYKKAGINRVSMGLQTTNNNLLKQIGRIHTFEQFLKGYKQVKQAGFENINIDLMIGLPNQTIKDLKTSIDEVLKLDPSHISVYSLIVEDGTKLQKMIEDKILELPDEELERQMYWYVKNKLELNGYNHYEISNFAKENKESKHNLNCWEQKEYIGLGISAHSYLNGVRFSNSGYDENEKWDYKNKNIEEEQTEDEMKKEYMLLGLRKIEGVSIQKFKEKFMDNPIYIYKKELEKLINQDLIMIDGDWIKLTRKGIDFANMVWEEFV